MPISIELIEEFFCSRMEFMDPELSQTKGLKYFDGKLHWHVLWEPESQLFRIAGDSDEAQTACETLEVEGYYSTARVGELSGGAGTALILEPIGVMTPRNYLVVTKCKDGKLSLSTTCGNETTRAQPGTPANGINAPVVL